MKTKFTPIAMKCNKEQWSAIEPKLVGITKNVWGLEYHPYLCNSWVGKYCPCIGNGSELDISVLDLEKRYEEWDEQIFLNACGIEPTYTLTKKQITYLHSLNECKEKIEEWFQEFRKPSLEVGKWYKNSVGTVAYNEGLGYGIDSCGFWFDKYRENGLSGYPISEWTLATPQEVEEALTKEAVKRGFKKGVKVHSLADGRIVDLNGDITTFYFKDNELYKGGCLIFKNGTWAEKIENTLPSDIEQLSLKYGKEELIKILSDEKN